MVSIAQTIVNGLECYGSSTITTGGNVVFTDSGTVITGGLTMEGDCTLLFARTQLAWNGMLTATGDVVINPDGIFSDTLSIHNIAPDDGGLSNDAAPPGNDVVPLGG